MKFYRTYTLTMKFGFVTQTWCLFMFTWIRGLDCVTFQNDLHISHPVCAPSVLVYYIYLFEIASEK